MYFDDKICKCPEYKAAQPAKAIGIGEPPGCQFCGLWPPFFLRVCEGCGDDYYKWFIFPGPSRTGKLECWDCRITFHWENNSLEPEDAVPPPTCCLPPKRSRLEVENDLENLLAELGF